MLGIIIFAILTFFVLKKLNSVLGEESDERFFGYDDNKKSMKSSMKDAEQISEEIDIFKDYSNLSQQARDNVKEISKKIDGFTLQKFETIATSVMEKVIIANNSKDKSTIKKFFSSDLANTIISSFEVENKNNLILVSVDNVIIEDVIKNGNILNIIVNFKTQQINYITDKNDVLIDGSKTEIINVEEKWCFTHNLSSKDNTWFINEIKAV